MNNGVLLEYIMDTTVGLTHQEHVGPADSHLNSCIISIQQIP